jgi:phage gp36-like protein
MYCSKTDILTRFEESEIISLTDSLGFGVIDDAVLQQAIDDATAEIDSYLIGRYSLPFTNAPADLVRKACDLTRFNLYVNRGLSDKDSQVERNYERIIRFLEQVSKGTISLQVSTPDIPPSNTAMISSDARQDWSGF